MGAPAVTNLIGPLYVERAFKESTTEPDRAQVDFPLQPAAVGKIAAASSVPPST
jgi:hypothetical protein